MVTTFLTALAEPNRFRIVELLRDGPRPVGEIAFQLGMRQPQASKHLQVLHQAGIVMVHPAANQRIYALQPKSFKEFNTWLETFRRIWEKRLDNLDDYLQELKEEERLTGGAPEAGEAPEAGGTPETGGAPEAGSNSPDGKLSPNLSKTVNG